MTVNMSEDMVSGISDSSVCVIVVAYNPGDELLSCLNSVKMSEGKIETTVVVVDNSSDATGRLVIEEAMHQGNIDVLLTSDSNLGFARAVNVGMRYADGANVLLLNPDAVLDPRCLTRLLNAANSDPAIGIATPVVRSEAGVRTMSAGRLPTISALLFHYSGLSSIFPRSSMFDGRYLFLKHHSHTDRDVEWAAGCCLLITRDTVSEIGCLSERWFMYGEDIEYCKRTLDAGKSIRLVAQATALHSMGVSVEKAGGPVSVMWPANTFDFYCQAYAPGWLRRTLWRTVFSTGLLSRAATTALRSTVKNESLSRARRLARFSRVVWTARPALNRAPDNPPTITEMYRNDSGETS